MMENKWERRDAKEQSKKRFVSDNRKSVHLIARMSLEPDKPKQVKRKSFTEGFPSSISISGLGRARTMYLLCPKRKSYCCTTKSGS